MSDEQPNLQEMVDVYNTTRNERLKLQKTVDKLETVEKGMKAEIIDEMRRQKLTVIGGQTAIVRYHKNDIGSVSDWATLHAHIQDTGEFDLLQLRVSQTAIAERWNNNQEVPGVQRYPLEDLSVSQIK